MDFLLVHPACRKHNGHQNCQRILLNEHISSLAAAHAVVRFLEEQMQGTSSMSSCSLSIFRVAHDIFLE
jgi:hypothetical protein